MSDINIDSRGFIKSRINGNSHTYETALSELIHNSLAAKATNIYMLNDNYTKPIIVDNGIGMDKTDIEKLKKFYDSSFRTTGDIGTFNIGLKEAFLKFGGKWIILSKKKNKEDMVYCEFNCDNLKEYAYGGIYKNCIDSGFCNKKREKIFINILKELDLIQDNENSLNEFSGTVVYQINCLELEDYEEDNSKIYQELYNTIKLKLSKYMCNFKYGIYSIDKIIKINKESIKTIDKFDWLCWNKTNNQLEFDIIVYKTQKNTLFAIEYNNTIYKYNKSKCIFDKLRKVDQIGKIKIKCNILNKTLHNNQELYYKNLKYKSSINGIMITRNGLDLYDVPNKYDNIYVKDETNRKFVRINVSFIGDDNLDLLFNILPNKSLFLSSNLNIKLKFILDKIKSIVYEYQDLQLENISLKKSFEYELNNTSLEDVQNKVFHIKTIWSKIVNNIIIKQNIININCKTLKLCKIINNYYKNIKNGIIKNKFNIFVNNYLDNLNKIKLIQGISKIQLKYKYLKNINIFKKLGLCIVVSKCFNYNNIMKNYFYYYKRITFINKSIKSKVSYRNVSMKIKITNIIENIIFKKKYNQLMLIKHKLLCNKYSESIFI